MNIELMHQALGQSLIGLLRGLDPTEKLVISKDTPEWSGSPVRVRVSIESVSRTYHTIETDILERAVGRLPR